MPDLTHSLLKQDIGHLRIIAEFWGLELEAIEVDQAREELSASLLDFELLAAHAEITTELAYVGIRARAEGIKTLGVHWPRMADGFYVIPVDALHIEGNVHLGRYLEGETGGDILGDIKLSVFRKRPE